MRRYPWRFWAGAVLAGLALALLAAVVASRWIGVGMLRPWGMVEFAGGRVSVNLVPLDQDDLRFKRFGSRAGLWPLAWTVETQPRYLSLGVMYGPNSRGIPRMDPPGPKRPETSWSALGLFFTQTTPQGRDFEFVLWPLAAGLGLLSTPLLIAGMRERRRRHAGHCPKCGYDLQEQVFKGVTIDKCYSCGYLGFDDKELEILLGHEHPNLFQSIANIFRQRT